MTTNKAFRVVLGLAMAAVAAGLLVLPGCRKDPPKAIEPPPVNVKVQRVTPLAEVADTFVLPGVLEPARVVDVSAEVAGRAELLEVTEGQVVQQGQVLVRLNTELLQAELDRAKAQAEYDQREFERMQEATQRGVATRNELDNIRTAASASRAALELAQAMVARSTIVAPIPGVLDHLPVEKGEYLKSGDLVARIVDLDRVKVRVNVPERDVSYLRLGQDAQIDINQNGGRQVSGQITYISELADPDTRTSPIEITVDNADHALRSGQIARVRLTRRVLAGVIMIPLEAVIPLEDGKEVYVVQDSKAVPRRVEIGLLQGSSVQIVSGLEAGDELIVSGHRFVGPHQAVRVVDEVAAGQ